MSTGQTTLKSLITRATQDHLRAHMRFRQLFGWPSSLTVQALVAAPTVNDDAAFRNDPTHRDVGAHVYTAFCRQVNGKGSTWISTVDADDVDNAKQCAAEQCAMEWGISEREVICIGIAEGPINIMEWAEGL